MALNIIKTSDGSAIDATSKADKAHSTKSHKDHKGKTYLPRKVVERIITMAATGYAPFEIIEGIQAEYGITLKPYTVSYYDPRNAVGEKMKQEWKDLFFRLHREYVSHLENVSMAHARTRVDRLESIYNKAIKEGNLKAATNAIKESRIEMVEYKRADHSATGGTKDEARDGAKNDE